MTPRPQFDKIFDGAHEQFKGGQLLYINTRIISLLHLFAPIGIVVASSHNTTLADHHSSHIYKSITFIKDLLNTS